MLLPRRTLRLCVCLLAPGLAASAQKPPVSIARKALPATTLLAENRPPLPPALGRMAPDAALRSPAHAELGVVLSAAAAGPNLCIYYGEPASSAGSPLSGPHVCLALQGADGRLATVSYVTTAPFRTGGPAQLFAVDSANLTIDVIATGSQTAPSLALVSRLPIAAAGPIAVADIDNDGNTDILLDDPLTGKLTLYAGNGDGTFQPAATVLPGTRVHSFLLKDLDGDNIPDLIAETTTGMIEIHWGTGDRLAPFAPESSGGAPGAISGGRLVAFADLDQDGVPDLLATTSAGPVVLFGQPSGGGPQVIQFAAPAALPGAPAQYQAATAVLADFDRDGVPDIAAVFQNLEYDPTDPSAASPTLLYLWHGNGDGTFSDPLVTPLDRSFSLAAAEDIDGDGVPDLVLSDGSVVAVLVNSGSRAFAAPASYLAGQGIQSLAATDVNQDGVPDLLVAGTDALLSPRAMARPRDTGSSPTQTALDLCVGPTATCPSDGLVNPPYEPTLTMWWGQTFNGTAVATADDGTALDAVSTIAIEDSFNGAPPVTLCTLAIAYGTTCPPSIGLTVGTNVGTHVFTAVYSGDSTHAPSNSPTITITVLQDITTGTLATSASTAALAGPVTFTATFTGNYAAPNGTVTFLDGSAVLGTATLVPSTTAVTSAPTPSTATFTTSSLALGTHSITASYPGSVNFLPVTATVQQAIVPPVASASQLTSSLNPASAGHAVTFTDIVTSAGTTPAGNITFTLGATTLGTATLSAAGIATFTTETLPSGSDPIIATYSGSATIEPSSASVVQTVKALPPPGSINFSITITPLPVSVGVGTSASVTVTVTPLTGYSVPVTLSCGNLPYETACTFGSQTIPAGGGSTTLLLSAMAPHSCDSNVPYFVAGAASGRGGLPAPALPAFALALGSLGLPGRRRWMRLLGALAAVAFTLQITGCGNCTDLGTRPASYTIQITGTAAANSETEAASVPLNVHV